MSFWEQTLEAQSLPYQAGLYLIGRKALEEAPIATRYELLRALYANNGLYTSVAKSLYDEGLWLPSIKPLGNPTQQVVEFYAATLLTGDLEIEAENQRILEPVQQFWRWSNFAAQRPVLSRENAMLGDSFLKVRGDEARRRVWFEQINPEHVYSFDVDERGYVTWIRIEVPRWRRLESGKTERYIHVEVWSKAEQSYRLWEYRDEAARLHAIDDDLSRLGTPTLTEPLSTFGIDFAPIVHIPFRRVPGEQRGQAAVWASIDKIVNLDLILTALHSNYFAYDRPTWALQSPGRDGSNRPIPPPRIEGAASGATGDELTMGRDRLFRMPAGWELHSTVPDINFEAGLRIVQDYQLMLERERPELVYSRISELGGNLSGRAIKFMLTKALKMAEEARANLEQGIVRMNQMALTQMQAMNLVGRDIGTFDAAKPAENFDHAFVPREVLPVDEFDDAQTEAQRATAYKTWREAQLPMSETLARLGYTEERAVELVELLADEAEPVEVEQ